MLATAFETPLPIQRFLSPSRNSIASFSPVDAPDGTAARPFAPLSRMTSASTVGLPRESMTCLPLISLIALISRCPRSSQFCFQQLVHFAWIGFSAARFHDLSDQKTQDLCLPLLELGDLGRILRKDIVDDVTERPFIRNLRQTIFLHELLGRLPRGVEFREHVTGRFQTDGAALHQLQQSGKPFRRNGGGMHGG